MNWNDINIEPYIKKFIHLFIRIKIKDLSSDLGTLRNNALMCIICALCIALNANAMQIFLIKCKMNATEKLKFITIKNFEISKNS